MQQPIKINRPAIFQKIRNRFGVRTGVGRSADLDMAIHPTFDVDPLLLESRAHHETISVNSVRSLEEFAVPDGEYWHVKTLALESSVDADYSLFLWVSRPISTGGVTQIPVTDLWVVSGIGVRVQNLDGLVARPGDSFGYDSLVWVANGSGIDEMRISYDLEDCSS